MTNDDVTRYQNNLRDELDGAALYGRSPAYSAARQVLFGCAAAAVTYGIGLALGVSLS